MFSTKITIFQHYKNWGNASTNMNRRIYPLFHIACLFYFYYDIVL